MGSGTGGSQMEKSVRVDDNRNIEFKQRDFRGWQKWAGSNWHWGSESPPPNSIRNFRGSVGLEKSAAYCFDRFSRRWTTMVVDQPWHDVTGKLLEMAMFDSRNWSGKPRFGSLWGQE